MDQSRQFDRRKYLQLSGAVGLAGVGLAGCLEDANGDDDAGTDDDDADDDADDDSQEIVAGTAPGFEPFEMVIDGELVGFDIDLLEAVVEETDYELAGWEELEFDGLIPALENENIDVIAAAMTITDEREETISFSDSYYSADQSVLVQSGGDVQPDDLEDLEGLNVGAQSGTTGEGIVQDELIDEGLIDEGDYDSYDNYVLAVEELERGTLDAIIIDEPVAESFAADREVEIAFTFETGEEYGFGVRQDDDDLQAALSEGIEAVEESSEYDEITQEWFDE
ncbi:ABC-type amino acid transport/signal transduction system, periplasmic component/domain [Natrarchaeobaculum sulfurireducens]|uniref:ABC-type amino acid transport/signal transduction system, periplasmic component/domain n=1 Tax=Natrarchaeobaculum sulfurireducens TaxID=2044521 RepID=A0A346PAV9_9EURY|nr:ABC-type amino acid transport/signal transduction system, periplasmic component/domain [Natrarchaeobaculum sulfurireducens]